MLTFNLKKQWYDKILRGEKTIEYREVKPYWAKRIKKEWEKYNKAHEPCMCILRLGYTKRFMVAKIVRVKTVDGKDTDLAIDAPVYAIHLADVREMA